MPAARTTRPYIRLTFGGSLGTPAKEIWSCTMKFGSRSGGTGDGNADVASLTGTQLLTAATAMKGHLATFHGSYGRTQAMLQYVKLNAVGANDLQLTDPTVDYQFAGVAGGVNTPLPFSTAVVYEHRTLGRSRGFASHGRISYPGAPVVEGATGEVTTVGTATIDAASTAYAALIAQLNGDTPGQLYELVINYASTNPAKPAIQSGVTQVFCSSIPGEIRRRQNKLTQLSAGVAVAGA